MTRVIELSDVALRLADADGLRASSPGYAIVDARRLIVGAEARAQARLEPRFATTQFWHRLSTDPLPVTHPSARTLADLAHAHLLDLWEQIDAGDDAVIFAIPSTFEREQLALLLGIVRECPFRAVGLVDGAVAAAAGSAVEGRRIAVIDAQMHSAALTVIDRDGDTLQRSSVIDLPTLGLAPLREATMNVIADSFVRETRFDPLHDAQTEQRLYDHLDAWLAELARGQEAELELPTATQVHRVNLRPRRIEDKLGPRFDALLEALPAEADVLVGPRLAAIPGLLARLRETAGGAVEAFSESAITASTLAHEQDIRQEGDALRFVTRLPAGATPTVQASGTERESTPEVSPHPAPVAAPQAAPEVLATEADAPTHDDAVTHVLLGHRAWPLSQTRIEIGGPNGLDSARLPLHLGTLEQRADGWHLTPAVPAPALPVMAPGEARVLGPAHTLVTLVRVERD